MENIRQNHRGKTRPEMRTADAGNVSRKLRGKQKAPSDKYRLSPSSEKVTELFTYIDKYLHAMSLVQQALAIPDVELASRELRPCKQLKNCIRRRAEALAHRPINERELAVLLHGEDFERL